MEVNQWVWPVRRTQALMASNLPGIAGWDATDTRLGEFSDSLVPVGSLALAGSPG